MANEVSELQKNLISALLDSGISKSALISTIDSLLAKQGEKDIVNTISEVEQQCTPEPATRAILLSESCSSDGESTKDYSPSEEISESLQSPVINRGSVVDHLLRMDPWQAARVIKMYMQQHNIPQRETVETTGLNQSHLSQHLNKGTPMKSQKRAILYTWFEKKQKEIVQQYSNPGKRAYSDDLDSPSKKSRRNRFKWGPASTSLLYQSYEQQRNPSKEERESLVIQCNKAECEQRGVSYSNVEGLGPNLVTESRVYNWFANRRKEETFRMKLAIEAASSGYQDNTGQSLSSPVTTQMSIMSPKNTIASSTVLVQPSNVRSQLTSPVQPSYPVSSSSFHQSGSQTMAAAIVTASRGPSRGQSLPGVGTLIQSTNIESNSLSQSQRVIPSQVLEHSPILQNNTTTQGSSQHASVPHQIAPSASQAMQAMAGNVRHVPVHPISTFPNAVSNFFPQAMVVTPNGGVPSVTVCHTAQVQSPMVTVQHMPNNTRSEDRRTVHHTQRNCTNNKNQVIQSVKKTTQDASGAKKTIKGSIVRSNDDAGVNGEHVIHHVVQAISEEPLDNNTSNDTLAVQEDPEKHLIGPKTVDPISGLAMTIKMEVNGESVEDVDSIGETVTIETTESCDSSLVKERRKNNTVVEMDFSNSEAVVVKVNGNHGDERGS